MISRAGPPCVGDTPVGRRSLCSLVPPYVHSIQTFQNKCFTALPNSSDVSRFLARWGPSLSSADQWDHGSMREAAMVARCGVLHVSGSDHRSTEASSAGTFQGARGVSPSHSGLPRLFAGFCTMRRFTCKTANGWIRQLPDSAPGYVNPRDSFVCLTNGERSPR